MNSQDPPGPRTVVRGILGVALGAALVFLVIGFVHSGGVDWQLLALVLALWGAWSFFGSLFDTLQPLGRLFGGALTGTGEMPGSGLTIEQETQALERLLAAQPPPPPHRALIAGIRLAEIYRTHEKDTAKADAVIARLVQQYPDAPELRYVRQTSG